MLDTGVDAAVKRKDGKYVEIQVKAIQAVNQSRFDVRDLKALDSPDYFVICVDMRDKTVTERGKPSVWVVPADKFKKYSHAGPKGKLKNGYGLDVDSQNNKRRLKKYQDAWLLLTG